MHRHRVKRRSPNAFYLFLGDREMGRVQSIQLDADVIDVARSGGLSFWPDCSRRATITYTAGALRVTVEGQMPHPSVVPRASEVFAFALRRTDSRGRFPRSDARRLIYLVRN